MKKKKKKKSFIPYTFLNQSSSKVFIRYLFTLFYHLFPSFYTLYSYIPFFLYFSFALSHLFSVLSCMYMFSFTAFQTSSVHHAGPLFFPIFITPSATQHYILESLKNVLSICISIHILQFIIQRFSHSLLVFLSCSFIPKPFDLYKLAFILSIWINFFVFSNILAHLFKQLHKRKI